MRASTLAMAFAVMVGGCTSGSPVAPAPEETKETAAGFEEAVEALGGGEECGDRLISDIVEVGEGTVHTFWRSECGEIMCNGTIESYPDSTLGEEAVERGSCAAGGRSVRFSGGL